MSFVALHVPSSVLPVLPVLPSLPPWETWEIRNVLLGSSHLKDTLINWGSSQISEIWIYIYIDLYNCNFIIPNMSQYGWTLTTLVVTWFQNSGWNVSSWIGFHQLLCLLFWGPNLTDAYVRRMGSLSAPFRVHTGILKTTTITILFNHKADHETHIDILHTLQSMNTMYICRYMMVYDGIWWHMMVYIEDMCMICV